MYGSGSDLLRHIFLRLIKKSNPILISVIVIPQTGASPIVPHIPDVDFVLLSGLNVDDVIATKYTN